MTVVSENACANSHALTFPLSANRLKPYASKAILEWKASGRVFKFIPPHERLDPPPEAQTAEDRRSNHSSSDEYTTDDSDSDSQSQSLRKEDEKEIASTSAVVDEPLVKEGPTDIEKKEEEKVMKTEEKEKKKKKRRTDNDGTTRPKRTRFPVDESLLTCSDRTRIIVVPNPKKRGSEAHARYEKYQAATTRGEFFALGGKGDWKFDVGKGFVKRAVD